MLFLVKGIITFTPYMSSTQKSKTTRIVEADNEEEANKKKKRANNSRITEKNTRKNS